MVTSAMSFSWRALLPPANSKVICSNRMQQSTSTSYTRIISAINGRYYDNGKQEKNRHVKRICAMGERILGPGVYVLVHDVNVNYLHALEYMPSLKYYATMVSSRIISPFSNTNLSGSKGQ